jgi:hypothetical protein
MTRYTIYYYNKIKTNLQHCGIGAYNIDLAIKYFTEEMQRRTEEVDRIVAVIEEPFCISIQHNF